MAVFKSTNSVSKAYDLVYFLLFLILSMADAVSNNDCLKGIGAQLKTSHVLELSAVGLIPTKASIPLASLSKIDSIFNSHLGAIFVLGPL